MHDFGVSNRTQCAGVNVTHHFYLKRIDVRKLDRIENPGPELHKMDWSKARRFSCFLCEAPCKGTHLSFMRCFFEKVGENALKCDFGGVLGCFEVQISKKKFVIFVKRIRKYRNFENSFRIWSNLMQYIHLNRLKFHNKVCQYKAFGDILLNCSERNDVKTRVFLAQFPSEKLSSQPPLRKFLGQANPPP